jgi:glycosyltransferase involved in cell wall biosynthesis
MRVLFISDVFFPRVNGVSTSLQTFWRELQRLGHEVTVIAPDYAREEACDPRLIRIPSRTVMFDPEDRMMRRRDIELHGDSLRRRGFDALHIQTPFVAHYAGVALARRLNIPKLETYHTFFEEYLYHYVPFLPKSWLRYAARRFSRAQCNEVDAVIVPSEAMREVLVGYGVTTRMEVLPTGIQLERFNGGDGARFRAMHGISQERPLLLHVGRVAFEKNIGFLLRVFKRVRETVPDALFVIAGEGPAATALRHEAQNVGISEHVLFVGNMDRETGLLDCYRAANVKVFASRTETQGLVLLEAMALGIPVVSTAIMGTKDVLRPGCGAEIVEEDEGQFAAAVVRVLRERDRAMCLSDAGKEYVKSWSAPTLAQRMVDLYERVAADYKSHRAYIGNASGGTIPER